MAQKKPFSLYKRTLPSGRAVYYAIFRDETGNRLPAVSTGEIRKGAAEAWAIAHLDARKREKPETFSDFTKNFFRWGVCPWIERHLAQGHRFGKRQAMNRRAHLDRYILPTFGKVKLSDIRPGPVSDFLLKLKQEKQVGDKIVKLPMANGTKNHILSTFSLVMDEAVFRELVDYNPIKSIRRFAKVGKSRDIFTADELRRLFPEDRAALLDLWQGPYWSAFFFTLLTTGLRLGELLALLWAGVDFSIPAISVTRAVKADHSIGPPKNTKPRAVYMPSRTVSLLREWKAASRYTSANDFVFHGKDGQNPIYQKTTWKYWTKGIEHAKIDTRGRVLVIHSLRHTYVSFMRRMMDEAALRFMTGHGDERMTDNYDKTGPMDKLRALLPGVRDAADDIWK